MDKKKSFESLQSSFFIGFAQGIGVEILFYPFWDKP
jgi:hypothetical protein